MKQTNQNCLSELKIKYQNTRGLRTKNHTFSLNLSNIDADIVCMTETWLNTGFFSSEYLINDFISYRRDRNYSSVGTRKGGGCWILHKPSLISSRLPKFESNIDFVEDVWIEITQPTGRLFLCTVYITSMVNRSSMYEQFFDKVRENLATLDSHDRVLIVGDINLSDIHWSKQNDGNTTHGNLLSVDSCELINLMNYGKLSQYNLIKNHRNEILDLVLSTDHFSSIEVHRSDQFLVPEDPYHPTLDITIKDPIGFMETDESFKKRNFRKGNYEQICAELELVDWNFIGGTDLNEGLDKFYNIINDSIDRNVPIRKNSCKFPFWYSFELRNAIKKKNRAHRKWKKTNNSLHYIEFSDIRSQCKVMIEKCHLAYVEGLQTNMNKNIKLFWAYTKKRKQTNSYPSKFEFNGETSQDPKRVCEMFSNCFQSAYIDHPSTPSVNTSQIAIPNNLFNISPEVVSKTIANLDENKNGGPDRIPNIFWKKTNAQIAIPLSHIFTKSLCTGIFPDNFKSALIMPIHKKGDNNLIENYRPICLLNTIALVFEKVVHTITNSYIHDKIISQQHGFRKNKSTHTNLFDYVNYIAQAMDEGLEVHAIYTDFSKAFDRVNHDKLLSKLHAIGLPQSLVNWYQSYLSNRPLRVVFNGKKSEKFIQNSGVPQGSVLGPILFNIFINDITSVLKCNVLLFADDSKIFVKVRNIDDCIALQNDINALCDWCDRNDLQLNANKCYFIAFSNRIVKLQTEYILKNKKLTKVDSIKDLGITFDSRLKFDQHIDEITRKASKMLGFVMRAVNKFTNIHCIKLLFNALVRSHLEYNCSIWNPLHDCHIKKIEKIQRNFTRQIAYKFGFVYESYEDRLRQCNLSSLTLRRNRFDMYHLHKIFNSNDTIIRNKLSINSQTYTNRHTKLFYVPDARTNYGSHSCALHRYQIIFNNKFSKSDILEKTMPQFKQIVLQKMQ